VEGSCEHGNEYSGSIKFWEISRAAEQLEASQEGLSFMKVFTYLLVEGRSLKLTTYFQLMPRLRIRGPINPPPVSLHGIVHN
jgi:hypothetical protein